VRNPSVVVTSFFSPVRKTLDPGSRPRVLAWQRSAFHLSKKSPAGEIFGIGGPYRIRTGDLLIANEALYQLS
jgi:hypothetical protein